MKRTTTIFYTVLLCLAVSLTKAQPQPEILYYNFDGSGTTVTNLASSPPSGAATATIMGGVTQGSTGLCGGALIGSGAASSTDYLNTGYATNLTGTSWTISMYTSDITASSTLFYVFGDAGAGSFRCFTNGVAGANNWILRGTGITDVYVNGGATVAPHLTTFVYDMAANNIYAYLDGILVSTVAQGAITISGAGPFKVMGYGTNVGSPAGGKIDEFRMYNRALSPAEVAQLVRPATYNTVSVTACGSYLSPAGNIYSTDGVYTDTLVNLGGCDSILTINLTVVQPSSATLLATACDSYTAPSGAVFNANGTYMDTIPNVAGCDSVITINLTVLQSSSASLLVNSCGSYTAPSGTVFSSSGTYMDTIPNVAGCDSVITIDLVVNNATASSFSVTNCNSYVSPGGMVISGSGTYMDTIPNVAGCDSVMTINVTINFPSASSINPIACDSFVAPSGIVYYTSGTFMDTIPNVSGCDSVITVSLTINTVNTGVSQVGTVLTAGATGAVYQWIDCSDGSFVAGATSQTYTAAVNGDYAVIVTENGCTDTSACSSITGIGIPQNYFSSLIKMFPNPSKGDLNLDMGTAYDKISVIITDIAGRIVLTQDIQNTQMVSLELKAAPGIYTVLIKAGTSKAVLRLIKQ
ncbi:MAG: LamG-like jellyroll fold domain-containing protein [Bacteroidota bacterium]|nr:LamG-like jellyroll fold domain-containing protein [Bacteroidota bacterium]